MLKKKKKKKCNRSICETICNWYTYPIRCNLNETESRFYRGYEVRMGWRSAVVCRHLGPDAQISIHIWIRIAIAPQKYLFTIYGIRANTRNVWVHMGDWVWPGHRLAWQRRRSKVRLKRGGQAGWRIDHAACVTIWMVGVNWKREWLVTSWVTDMLMVGFYIPYSVLCVGRM